MAATFVMDVARSDANAILFFETVFAINDIETLILQPSAHGYCTQATVLVTILFYLVTECYVLILMSLDLQFSTYYQPGSQNYHESKQLSSGHRIRFVHGFCTVYSKLYRTLASWHMRRYRVQEA